MKQFKNGDKVYCPRFGTKIFKLIEHENAEHFPFSIKIGNSHESFTSEGKDFNTAKVPAIFKATEKNRKLLFELYGVEFEKPVSFLDKHLSLGSKVLCLFTYLEENLPQNVWEIDTTIDSILLIVDRLEDGTYMNQYGKITKGNLYPIAVNSVGGITYLE